jgi:DNA ligase-1
MKHFSELIIQLDQTTKTTQRLAALGHFFNQAAERDILWAVALFTGKRPKRALKTAQLRAWAAELSGNPLWLFEESYHIVGDLAETIALVLPQANKTIDKSLSEWIAWLDILAKAEESRQKEMIFEAWNGLSINERFVFNKLITGGFRVGVSQKLMVRALSKHLDRDENVMAHRLMGNWDPKEITFAELLISEGENDDISRPYPFYLAYQLEEKWDDMPAPEHWQAEWKWDGIRGQVIVRNRELFVWSRGEELVTDKYPEYNEFAEKIPNGTVLDGEILAFADGEPLPFSTIQKRIGRKTVGKKLLAQAPVAFMAYDILEFEGKDIRSKPLIERRMLLEQIIAKAASKNLICSQTIDFESWEKLAELRAKSREMKAEGLMLKKKDADYKVGRKRGDWWKWKVDPMTIDAVMIYAMRGHGRRANLYTDYTFAVWDNDKLVPFAKAYSGLTDKEFREVDAFVKKNTLERFGPVRSVKAELVFELAFEGIAESGRHKSGIALRFPRMKRWRQDKPASEANTLADLKQLL